jgi:hypothetical protein
VYTRERKHIGTKCSRITCLALPLPAAQSLGSRALADSQSLRCLTVVTENKKLQTNKQTVYQIVPNVYTNSTKDATRHYELVSTRITKIGATVKKL